MDTTAWMARLNELRAAVDAVDQSDDSIETQMDKMSALTKTMARFNVTLEQAISESRAGRPRDKACGAQDPTTGRRIRCKIQGLWNWEL